MNQLLLKERYQLVRLLREGGCGQVYLAEDTQLKRQVAIKRLHSPDLSNRSDPRFQREARIMASLNHPNILGIYDTFEVNGQLHLVMEYSAAGSMKEFLERAGSRLSISEVIQVGQSVAGALQAVHREGIIHRDIKPANILLIPEGQNYVVKVADFGIAHLPRPAHQLTQTGDMLGTPSYWAPEQVRGDAYTKTDVYALGVILFELLAGKHYLDLTNIDDSEKRRRILEELPQPLRTIRPDVPEWLDHLIGQALQKEPSVRPNAAEFYELLCSRGQAAQPQLNSSRIQAPPQTSIQRPSLFQQFLVGIVTAALVATLLGLGYLNRPDIQTKLVEADATTSTPTNATRVVVSGTHPTDGLRLRQGPGLEESILTILPENSELTLLQLSEDGTWAQVESDLGSGWVYAAYLYHIDTSQPVIVTP